MNRRSFLTLFGTLPAASAFSMAVAFMESPATVEYTMFPVFRWTRNGWEQVRMARVDVGDLIAVGTQRDGEFEYAKVTSHPTMDSNGIWGVDGERKTLETLLVQDR